MNSELTGKVRELARPIVKEAGLELAEVEYEKEGNEWFLRILLDGKDKPVDVDACSAISERLSKALDEADPVPNSYFLEVCSRGVQDTN